MSQQRSLEQKRAAQAWDCVKEVTSRNYKKDYLSLARSAPADIQANGLGQTLAFWRAKKKDEDKALYQHVAAWVKLQMRFTQPEDLLEWIMRKASTDEYRRATTEAIAFLSWVKRFAEAELEVSNGISDSQEKR
ncbi:MAG: type III-B CRISPR module-associated protein Cmr5 [Candidatus Binatia bacterium]